MAPHSTRVFAAALVLAAYPSSALPSQPAVSGLRTGAAARPSRPIPRDGRRPAGYCSGTGANAFAGGGLDNVAGGLSSGFLAGQANYACGPNDAIGAGVNNFIYPNGGADYGSFIGAGASNGIYSNGFGGTYEAFIGAGNSNAVAAWYGGIAAGGNNAILAAGAESFIGAGDHNSSNAQYAFVGAGHDNYASGNESFVGAGDNNSSATYAFVGAGLRNTAGEAAFEGGGSSNGATGQNSFVGAGTNNVAAGSGAVIGGGGMSFFASHTTGPNYAGGTDAFVGAGDGNSVTAPQAFLGAGVDNVITYTAAGGTTAGTDSVIGGGYRNLVEGVAAGGGSYGVVAGGAFNVLTGVGSAIGGGSHNAAAGEYAAIPGGYGNVAKGIESFAAGTKAGALHNGTFVWSDDAGSKSLDSSAPYQFLARASGGFFLYSNAAATAGVKLAPGSGAWASLSDRTMKNAIVPLDDAAVLDKVAALPVSEWSYTSEGGVRHVGPMAQDFYAAFKIGEDDRHITSIDEDGVALAAIKGLYAKSTRQNAALHAQVADLRRELEALAAKVAVLEKR
jgi:hypothetical protein